LDTASVEGGVGPYLFSLDGVVFSDIDSFTGLSAGYYTVYVQDLFGCSDTAEVYIAEPEPIEIATVPNYARINLGETVEARVQLYFTPTFPPITYTWTPTDSIDCDTCSSVVLNPIEDTRYIVTVRDSNGCFDTAHVYVNVDPQRNLFIPTAFTPNGDGLNDVFMVYGSAGVREVLNFQIYDRWGEQLFTAANFPPTDPAFGWNGQYKGKVLNPGTFVYYIEVEFIDGKIRKYQGDVTIIR
jgi:gliding motility-associated-like protein